MNVSEDILISCCNYDRKAQTELYEAMSGTVMSICKRYSNNPNHAEDLFQEAFIHLFKNIHKFDINRGIEYFPYWMKKVVANLVLQQLRFEKKNLTIETPPEELAPSSEYIYTLQETYDTKIIENCINKLSTPYKTIFNLFVIEGFSHQEISKMLDINVSSSRTYLTRARKKLINLLKEEGIIER